MKGYSAGLIIVLLVLVLQSCNQKSQPAGSDSDVRIISYNIKYDDPSDSLNNWNQRRDRVVTLLKLYQPDFIGIQEGLLHQLEYMKQKLGNMNWIGVGRTDGGLEGEFSAIFYNTKRYELIADTDTTIWLSQTPSIPSSGWDAALPRILTWAKFRSSDKAQEFYVFNTHFDHIGDTARAQSAKLILKTINEIAGNSPVILTGDFNALESSETYQNLTQGPSSLKDAFYVSELPHVGPLFTYEGFYVQSTVESKRIDYVFVNERVSVKRHAFISDFREGKYPSDHLPVLVDIALE